MTTEQRRLSVLQDRQSGHRLCALQQGQGFTLAAAVRKPPRPCRRSAGTPRGGFPKDSLVYWPQLDLRQDEGPNVKHSDLLEFFPETPKPRSYRRGFSWFVSY
jgi:hypothetical protein